MSPLCGGEAGRGGGSLIITKMVIIKIVIIDYDAPCLLLTPRWRGHK